MKTKLIRQNTIKDIIKKKQCPLSITDVYLELSLQLSLQSDNDISRKTVSRDIIELIESGDLIQTQDAPLLVELAPNSNIVINLQDKEIEVILQALTDYYPTAGHDIVQRIENKLRAMVI